MKELVSFGKLHIVMTGEKNGTSVEQLKCSSNQRFVNRAKNRVV